jgi:RHS repeat-associated protein
MQVAPDGTTLYIHAFGVSTELFGAGTAAARRTDYLSVGNAKVGMRIVNIAAETVSTRYFHTDHLGSISVITDENAVVLERLSYDAWGKRRFASGADDPTGSITSQSPRGFTGEEQLDTVALVHLNGRVYDPMVGRMISADPTVPDPLNAQSWNRYSYVGNAFTDPSGFSWFSSFFHSVSNFLANNSIVRSVLQIASTVILTAVLGPLGTLAAGVLAAAASAAIVTGLSGGNLGQILRASVIAGATAFAFYEVGNLTPGAAHALGSAQFDPAAYAENVAGHALVGCASSAATGGSCESGALSGAVSAGASPLINGQSYGTALVEHAVLGGVASVAGGGKFANGAITSAFGYMFNDAAHNCLSRCRADGTAVGLADAISPLDFFNPYAIARSLLAFGVESTVEVAALRFTQTTASPWFQEGGNFAGQTISEVAAQLRSGALTAADVPVAVVGDGLIVNTRSALALTQAGVPQSERALVQGSAQDVADMAAQPWTIRDRYYPNYGFRKQREYANRLRYNSTSWAMI